MSEDPSTWPDSITNEEVRNVWKVLQRCDDYETIKWLKRNLAWNDKFSTIAQWYLNELVDKILDEKDDAE